MSAGISGGEGVKPKEIVITGIFRGPLSGAFDFPLNFSLNFFVKNSFPCDERHC